MSKDQKMQGNQNDRKPAKDQMMDNKSNSGKMNYKSTDNVKKITDPGNQGKRKNNEQDKKPVINKSSGPY